MILFLHSQKKTPPSTNKTENFDSIIYTFICLSIQNLKKKKEKVNKSKNAPDQLRPKKNFTTKKFLLKITIIYIYKIFEICCF